MYEIMSLLIDRLQMVRLWGYGFPDLPLFVFVLRKYLEYVTFIAFYIVGTHQTSEIT